MRKQSTILTTLFKELFWSNVESKVKKNKRLNKRKDHYYQCKLNDYKRNLFNGNRFAKQTNTVKMHELQETGLLGNITTKYTQNHK